MLERCTSGKQGTLRGHCTESSGNDQAEDNASGKGLAAGSAALSAGTPSVEVDGANEDGCCNPADVGVGGKSRDDPDSKVSFEPVSRSLSREPACFIRELELLEDDPSEGGF